MQTAQLKAQLPLDGPYHLPDDECGQNRGSPDLEYALAEQEWEFVRYRSDYRSSSSQSTSVAGSGCRKIVGTKGNGIGNADSGTDREDKEGPSRAIVCPSGVFDDLPSIPSETNSLPDNDEYNHFDTYSFAVAASEPCDEIPSIRSETPALPHDAANSDSRHGSAYYLENPTSLDDLPSIESENPISPLDEGDNFLSDGAYTAAECADGHHDDLPSISSEIRVLSEDDYSFIDSVHESLADSMSSWATLVPTRQSTTINGGIIWTDISHESLTTDVHGAGAHTSSGVMHTFQRCSKALLGVIDGIGCIRWGRLKPGILTSIFTPQTQSNSKPPP